MQIEGLSWFPGHMTKTKRMIIAEIKNMDAVCEIVDARIPMSSRNPDVDEMVGNKPRIIVLNRVDQADPKETKRGAAYFRGKGYAVLEVNAKNGVGTNQFAAAVRSCTICVVVLARLPRSARSCKPKTRREPLAFYAGGFFLAFWGLCDIINM